MAQLNPRNTDIPLAQERLVVEKRSAETGRVQIRTVVDEEHVLLKDGLRRESVQVERIEINRDVDSIPEIRRDGEVLIVPVVEEDLFVEKRLRLVEELHVRVAERVDPLIETLPVRRVRAVIERLGPREDVEQPGDDHDPNHHSPL
jgi:uncharacterized protein (TIGR02271 family)